MPKIFPLKKWKVTFADGSYVVVDARGRYEAVQLAKPVSRLTIVSAVLLTGWELEMYGRRMMRKNVAITPEMVRGAKGESSKLLERLSKIDRNSGEARKIRRRLRKLGVSLSQAVSREERQYKGMKMRLPVERTFPSGAVSGRKTTRRERELKRIQKISIRPERIKELREIERKAQMELPLRGKVDQVLDTAQVLVQKVGYRSKSELVKRLMEIYPRLTDERANRIANQVIFKENPPRGSNEIYGRIIAIEAQKGPGSTFPGERFRHKFEPGAKILARPDGSVLIKGKKKLWKEFEY